MGVTKRHPAFPPGLFSLVPGVFHGDAGVPSVGYMAESATVGYLVWYHPPRGPGGGPGRDRALRPPRLAARHLAPDPCAGPPVEEQLAGLRDARRPSARPGPRVSARGGAGATARGAARHRAFAAVCDASFLAAKGIPAVVFGPGDLREAHAIDESVEIEEIRSAARVVAHAAVRWCGVA